MNKKIFNALGFAMVTIAVLFAVGCAQPSSGDDVGTTPTTTPTVHDNGSGGTYTAPTITGSYYPAVASTTAYTDGILAINFDSTPTIGTTGTVKIYKADGTLVDTINPSAETYYSGVNSGGVIGAINVKNQLIQVSGTTVVIKPHTNATAYSVLDYATSYYVTIDAGLLNGNVAGTTFAGITSTTVWTFTTRAAPSLSGTTISVSTTDAAADFYSIQGALNYLRSNGSTGSWTINVAAGSYLERLFYYGVANVSLVGPVGNDHGDTARVYWTNLDAWNSGSRMRTAFLWQNSAAGVGNLNLANMTFVNTCDRSIEGTSGTQAESFYFDATSYLTAYNTSFISHQDTLLIGNNGGRAWFYDCYIEGDTDFIWGYPNVALFENCQLRCVEDTAITGQKSYIFASRTPTSGAINKGFVLMNSTIAIDDGVTAYYGRNSGADTTAAVFNNAFTTTGTGTLSTSLWGGSASYYYNVAGDCTVGYMDYNNTLNGTVVGTSSRLTGCYALSQAVYDREYNGRAVILNRGFNTTTSLYATGTKWDISAYETDFGASADTSLKNVFVEPVYVKNLIGGSTSNFTATAYDGNTSFTWSTGNATYASVDTSGIVTAATGVTGSTTVNVTSGTSGTGYATVKVIPSHIVATAIDLSGFTTTSMEKNDAAVITAVYTPLDCTDTSTTWTSSNTSVLTVTGTTKSALVKAVGAGTATITATSTMWNTVIATTATITVADAGLTIGDIPVGGYTFNFTPLNSGFGTLDTFLAGTAYTSALNLNTYNVGVTNTTTPMAGKYLQLMQKSKAASLSAVSSFTPSTSCYLRMKNTGFTGSVAATGVVTLTALNYTVGTDWLLLHNVNVPAAGITITVSEAKASSAVGRAVGIMVVDPAATGTVAYGAAKAYKLDPNSTTVPYAHTMSYVPAAAETVDIVIMGTNDVYLGSVGLANN